MTHFLSSNDYLKSTRIPNAYAADAPRGGLVPWNRRNVLIPNTGTVSALVTHVYPYLAARIFKKAYGRKIPLTQAFTVYAIPHIIARLENRYQRHLTQAEIHKRIARYLHVSMPQALKYTDRALSLELIQRCEGIGRDEYQIHPDKIDCLREVEQQFTVLFFAIGDRIRNSHPPVK